MYPVSIAVYCAGHYTEQNVARGCVFVRLLAKEICIIRPINKQQTNFFLKAFSLRTLSTVHFVKNTVGVVRLHIS